MDFSLDSDSLLLQSTAAKYLRNTCPPKAVKEMIASEQGFSMAVWKEIADLGWTLLIYPEEYGGLGGRFLDLYLLFVEIGKAVLPSPFLSSVILSGLLILESGDEKARNDLLPSIAAGETIVAPALGNSMGLYDCTRPTMAAKRTGEGFSLDGKVLFVDYAGAADHILICAGIEDAGPTLFLIPSETRGLALSPISTISAESTFALEAMSVTASSDSVVGRPGAAHEYLERVLPKATALICGEMCGGLERVVEMTVEYMKERVQFGKPLGILQAVQHKCADMESFLAGTRVICLLAASRINEGLDARKQVAMAKAWTNEAYKEVTWIAHQLHGGIGFTEEHDLHLYFKHAKTRELMFGDAAHHRRELAGLLGL